MRFRRLPTYVAVPYVASPALALLLDRWRMALAIVAGEAMMYVILMRSFDAWCGRLYQRYRSEGMTHEQAAATVWKIDDATS